MSVESKEKQESNRELDPSTTLEAGILPLEELEEEAGKEGASSLESKVGAPTTTAPKSSPPAKTITVQQVEALLSENFKDIYKQLPPKIKTDFKEKGEAAARQIAQIIVNPKPPVPRTILQIIKIWLTALRKFPGINFFFIEQQAKLETDRILFMHQNKHRK